MLSNEQQCRYERHILMPEIGEELQSKLLQSSVLIIGAGGLGAPIAYYLTAAGVGHIGIIDSDVVELSNLQRQIIHNVNDLGRQKVESAKEKLQLLNPDTKITAFATHSTALMQLKFLPHSTSLLTQPIISIQSSSSTTNALKPTKRFQ